MAPKALMALEKVAVEAQSSASEPGLTLPEARLLPLKVALSAQTAHLSPALEQSFQPGDWPTRLDWVLSVLPCLLKPALQAVRWVRSGRIGEVFVSAVLFKIRGRRTIFKVKGCAACG